MQVVDQQAQMEVVEQSQVAQAVVVMVKVLRVVELD
jgi:hypothetical protein